MPMNENAYIYKHVQSRCWGIIENIICFGFFLSNAMKLSKCKWNVMQKYLKYVNEL